MNKTFKKAIAVILSVLMVIMSVPFTALAAVGDYTPNIKLQFGTFFDSGATDYNDYSTSGTAGSDFSYSSLSGVPVDYKYKVTNGVASGTLYIDKDKANTYNEASESGYKTLSEDLQFGVGDYFTMTVLCDNVASLAAVTVSLGWNDTVELAGVYSYKAGKKTAYALGSESEMKAANKGAWFKGGTSFLNEFTTSNKGLHSNLIPKDADANMSSVLTDTDGNTIGVQAQLATPGMAVTETTSENGFINPDTGEANYTYKNCGIIATYAFKIVKDGNIDFNIIDPSNVRSAYYIASTADGNMPNECTSYAKNYYNPSTKQFDNDTEWPGSAKMTFMGQNQFVDAPAETTYEIKFNDINGKPVGTPQTVKEGDTPKVPSTNTPSKVEFKSDNKHEVTTYSWPEVSAATADTTYTEVAATVEEDCNIPTHAVTSNHTIVSGTVLKGTCTVCGHEDTQTKDDKLDGTAYYAALEAAKNVDSSKYTAESYAKVTAALKTYDKATVEAYTDQAQVTAAATALENAYNGLVPLPTSDVYTYTFDGGKTQTVTVDKGATPTAPTNTPAKTVDNNDGTHTVTSYTWEKTGEFTFAEKANAVKSDCTYGDFKTKTPSTLVSTGVAERECSVCGHVDTTTIAKLDGTAYYAALAAAEAENADDYTAESYAKVTAALEANAKATVETYTDQAKVNDAATALENAVKGLVKVYTITFTNAAGTVVDTQKLAAGATPVAPKANTADTAATPAGSKQHSHTTYSWPAVSAVTANANYKEVAKVVTEDCTKGTPVVTEPTLDKAGSETTSCTICGQVLETKVLPQLKGYDITVTKTAYGTTTLNSEDATNGKTTKVLANSTVTLTAKANKGAEFVGWKVAQKLVSTNETYSFTAVANTEVTPVFTETATSTFVVVFIDMYGNVIGTPQEVPSGADIKVPATAPIYPGYTFKGWALTNDQITALTEGKTIRAIYEKDATQTYTVKAAGATITVNGKDYNGKAENVAYDAKVTVTKAGATSWAVNGATVGYGESYSFFCASDIELTAVTKADDTSKTQVAIVSTTRPSATDCDVLFVATRTLADNETVVSQGFVYGKNAVASDLTLENVGNAASGTNPGKVKVAYNGNGEQFGLNYGITAMTGTAAARAFVVTQDADGNVNTYYSEASLYSY